MLTVEAIRTAQGRYGKKPLTGEEVRWGIENLNLDAARLKTLGFAGMMQPLKLSCQDHEGVRMSRIHQWDGTKWVFVSDWIEGDQKLLRPMVESAARAYAKEKNITPRDCSKA
jgi:branched-chain amino acid transport system substrate-binding protein